MLSRIFTPLLLFCCCLALAACSSAAGPIQIAVQPHSTPITIYPPPSEVIYRAYIELSVDEVDTAAARAIQLTNIYGGYLNGSTTWYANNQKVVSMDLAVPNGNFKYLYNDLAGLGSVVQQSAAGEEELYNPAKQQELYSTITLKLVSNRRGLPITTRSGWDPRVTFSKAYRVFLSIFGFIMDILIWLLVVAGPFLLVAWIVWWLFRRRSQKPAKNEVEKQE